MKIMSDDDALDSVDTEDTEEDIFNPHSLKGLRTLRSQTNSNQDLDQNSSIVRRSTRNKSQTYDNLNTSWIFGTQTLKGYPMYKQNGSSSDKEMVDDTPPRSSRLRRRMPIRSRENHPPNKTPSIHMRDRNNHSSSRELRVKPRRLRERSNRNREIHERSDRDRGLRERPDQDRERREKPERHRELRNKPQMSEKSDYDLRDRNDHDIDLRALKERQDRDRLDRDLKDNKSDVKNNSDVKTGNEEKEPRSRKSDSPCRLREGPVTRLSNSYAEKDEKIKSEPNRDDDDNSQESEKVENNDNSENDENDGYEDMYTRIKRTRRASQRQLQQRQIAEDSDMSESSDTPSPRKYSLRQKKPTVDRFQANVEPVRRSIRAFRSVLSNSMRRRKHRSKSSSSSDSTDSEPQRYDKKKSKKSRQSSIPQGGPTDNKADINPISVDTNITFSDVGGLESHIHCLKEMVVFPMMYPDVFDRFHITPPKGVLFHGPPGTGKTLIARALANECSQGSKKVAFFMRKGADCLSKWVGESERQLRLLFEQAQQMKPSIIFFDEIDGLAPVRSTKQDQIHASIVSTLLALMDGLSDRGEVIIIGATNRIDAIDPALRRPGRFDRELFFPLPAKKERLEIFKIHVKKWSNPPDDHLLQLLADKATGYCGSDLKALCTEAVIQGLKRTYPQIYLTTNRLLLNPARVEVKKTDFIRASSLLVPSSHRVTPCVGRRLTPFIEPLLESSLQKLLITIKKIFPQGTNHALAKSKVSKGIYRPRLLIAGGSMARNQGPQLAKAIIYHMEHLPVHTLNVSTLFAESARSPEETCVQVFNEATRNIPSIIYIAAVDQWWPLVPETVKAVFLCCITSLVPSIPILILATSEVTYEELPIQLKNLFSKLRGEVHLITGTIEEQRTKFFRPVFTVQSLRPPQLQKKNIEILEELPLAPDPEPKKLTTEEKKVLFEKEEISLRELRIFLREICAKLARNRQFFMFTKPVDTEEVPDYNEIIAQPMDLETMMTKIDMHCYLCARDFLDDIDLICRNALEYNPDRDPADKLIRHRACSLRDNAYALIKAELDSDFEDKCREISKNRKIQLNLIHKKKESPKSDYGHPGEKGDKRESNTGSTIMINGKKFSSSRKRKIPAWARGYVKKVHKKKKISFGDSTNNEICENKTVITSETSGQGIDLEKFQEFESEAHSVLNGHVPIFDNTDTDNESQNESTKNAHTNVIDVNIDKHTFEKRNYTKLENIDTLLGNSDKIPQNNSSYTLSRNESLNVDDLSFAFDSDSSLINDPEESDKVLIDKTELENIFMYTVKATSKFPIELLCDTYVQLSRRVSQYSQTYDRKELPKDLLQDVKRFEQYNTVENERFIND
ncbi:PREDICTED: ATPase family AAA domain-containing protein 2-like isoform X2 [Ceratosolen solmsi marchali]|uniref:ATPase family AAA domain-containing protein 2-like isoform X2 n=1 Tax=Ceratosolen solmsi marchali TaxID=326594 RepID=A0AAJ7E2D1_9HYME|nr:PREDICTED: ATPase family AAA domain-containing protein 2-like isoform X2 [Ceratosolen solmsi marchali]